jgi:hypothetical protein
LIGDLIAAIGVCGDGENPGSFTDVEAEPGRPTQRPHDDPIRDPAPIIERREPVDDRGRAPRDQGWQ